jgi:hypothetical protein
VKKYYKRAVLSVHPDKVQKLIFIHHALKRQSEREITSGRFKPVNVGKNVFEFILFVDSTSVGI